MQTIEEIRAEIATKQKEWNAICDVYNAEIRSLQTQLVAAKLTESGLNAGDRVMITKWGTPEYGVFEGYRVKYGDEITPVIYRLKKDGTASKFELYAYGAKIEKV